MEFWVWGLGFRILGSLQLVLRIYDAVDLCLRVYEFRGCTVGGLCLGLGVYGLWLVGWFPGFRIWVGTVESLAVGSWFGAFRVQGEEFDMEP